MLSDDYKQVLENHAARAGSAVAAVGVPDLARFMRVAQIELELLRLEGLTPSSALLDFGCGSGRLALVAIPYLASGSYLGVDISKTMIGHAIDLNEATLARSEPGRYRFEIDDGGNLRRFGLEFDVVCAYSVFTQMEHEDTLRCLRQFASVLKPGGKVVCSVLNIESQLAKLTLLGEAEIAPDQRWKRLRTVTTSYGIMEAVAELAGFDNFRWYRGEEFKVQLGDGAREGLRQSVLVAERM